MDQAVEIFNIVDDDLRNGASLTVMGMTEEAARLCKNFELSARGLPYKERCREGHAELEAQSAAIGRVCRRAQPWREVDFDELERGFDGFFKALQHLMNLSESEVAETIVRNLGLMATATADIRDKIGRYQLDGLIANVDTVSAVVMKTLKNRITVTQDPSGVAVLAGAVEAMEHDLPQIKSMSSSRPGDPERAKLCDRVIRCVEDVVALLSQSMVTHATFAPPEDVQKFGTVRQKERLAKQTAEKVSLSEWNVQRVCDLFESLGASEAERAKLRDEGVDGAALALLSNEELGSELGLKLGVRKKYANWLVHVQQENESLKEAAMLSPPKREEIKPPASRVQPPSAPSKPRPGPSVRHGGGIAHKPRGVSTIRRMSGQVDAVLQNMLAELDDI